MVKGEKGQGIYSPDSSLLGCELAVILLQKATVPVECSFPYYFIFPYFLSFWEPLPPLAPSGLGLLMSPSIAGPEVLHYPFLVFLNPAHTPVHGSFIKLSLIIPYEYVICLLS